MALIQGGRCLLASCCKADGISVALHLQVDVWFHVMALTAGVVAYTKVWQAQPSLFDQLFFCTPILLNLVYFMLLFQPDTVYARYRDPLMAVQSALNTVTGELFSNGACLLLPSHVLVPAIAGPCAAFMAVLMDWVHLRTLQRAQLVLCKLCMHLQDLNTDLVALVCRTARTTLYVCSRRLQNTPQIFILCTCYGGKQWSWSECQLSLRLLIGMHAKVHACWHACESLCSAQHVLASLFPDTLILSRRQTAGPSTSAVVNAHARTASALISERSISIRLNNACNCESLRADALLCCHAHSCMRPCSSRCMQVAANIKHVITLANDICTEPGPEVARVY